MAVAKSPSSINAISARSLMSASAAQWASCESIRWIMFRSDRDSQTTSTRLRGSTRRPIPASDKGCDARTHALRSRNGDDDAFGRGTHGTSESAQIKAGLILLEKRKDHRSVAVRAERALVGSFAVEKRANGTIQHRRLRQLGGSATLSVTDRCLDGAVIKPPCASGSGVSGQHCSLSKTLMTSSRPKPFSGLLFRQFGRIRFNLFPVGTICRSGSCLTADILSGIC